MSLLSQCARAVLFIHYSLAAHSERTHTLLRLERADKAHVRRQLHASMVAVAGAGFSSRGGSSA